MAMWVRGGVILSSGFILLCVIVGVWQFWSSSSKPARASLSRAQRFVSVIGRLQFVYWFALAALQSEYGGATQWFFWAVSVVVSIDLLRVITAGRPR